MPGGGKKFSDDTIEWGNGADGDSIEATDPDTIKVA